MISRLLTRAPLIGVFVLATLTVAKTQTATMSPDETTVRLAYAKLAYGVQLGAIHDALNKNPNLNGDQLAKAIASKEMTFKITNLTSGNIAQIANRKYADFVTPPGGLTLHLASGQFTYTPEEGKSGEVSEWNAQGNWQQERDGSAGWDKLLINEVMQGNHDTSTRYVALTVTVSYLGQSRTYNSLWFFGGPSKLIPVDLIVGNGVLGDFAAINDVAPHTLLETKLFASSPGVRSWLQTHQLADADCAGKAACCLPTGRCGVTPTAASASFAKLPLRIPRATTPQSN